MNLHASGKYALYKNILGTSVSRKVGVAKCGRGLYGEPPSERLVFSAKKLTPWLESACELYRPTERPPLVGEVSTNFNG
jgi:hypothetical protein